jgi:hypothetical protein
MPTLTEDTSREPNGVGASAVDFERSFSPRDLAGQTLRGRAVEAVIWGMPAVNFDLMYQAMVRETAGDFNQVVYWSRLPDWKNQTLTPNPDAIYLMPFFNTADVGPVVLEVPPAEGGSITGSIDDCWQGPLEDVGPAGADKGQGGKYLILPPGYTAPAPDGYIPLPSANYRGYALLRSILQSGSDDDVAQAVAYARQIKVYPLSAAANPPPTAFFDAIDVVFDATIPYDLRFFRSLHRMVQAEPWLDRDRLMIDMLRSIGIEKGKPFRPDLGTAQMLTEAAQEAHAWLVGHYESVFASPMNDAARWALPVSQELVRAMSCQFAETQSYPTDARALAYHMAFFSAKHLGAGQYYLMTIRDRDGDPLHGDSYYRLTVPARAPVKQYWSATIYDRATHALIRNMPHASRSSQSPELEINPDGSVDLCFGPQAPGGKHSNWVPTNVDGDFEVLFRFYGPTPALFDKSWVLPDIEKIG